MREKLAGEEYGRHAGKAAGVAGIVNDIEGAAGGQGLKPLAVTIKHGQLAGTLQGDHRDPFERMLIAPVIWEGLVLVANDMLFDRRSVGRFC